MIKKDFKKLFITRYKVVVVIKDINILFFYRLILAFSEYNNQEKQKKVSVCVCGE